MKKYLAISFLLLALLFTACSSAVTTTKTQSNVYQIGNNFTTHFYYCGMAGLDNQESTIVICKDLQDLGLTFYQIKIETQPQLIDVDESQDLLIQNIQDYDGSSVTFQFSWVNPPVQTPE